MDEIVQRFSEARRGFVVAPAGCGKTELIAESVAALEEGRALVLTHTHAGVHSLRTRLRRKGVPSGRYQLDTIAGWALRYAIHFPQTSKVPDGRPRKNYEWRAVYEGAKRLLNLPSIRRGVARSYTCAYIDEYQDCDALQHGLVMALADLLPCRIVGDPLQGIFDFGGQQIVDWETDVRGNFEEIGELSEPWRWNQTNRDLGDWTVSLRVALEHGRRIDLTNGPVEWHRKTPENQRRACMAAMARGGTFVGIQKFPGECHRMAKYLSGSNSDEEMEAKDLFKAARKLDGLSGFPFVREVIAFANTCVSRVGTELRTADGAFGRGQSAAIRANTKHKDAVRVLNKLAAEGGTHGLQDALQQMHQIPGCRLFRSELWNAMLRAARLYEAGEASSLEDAAWRARERTRRLGKRLPNRLISRTLLVKGMEFDHAVVLDADRLDRKNFYVAATRASRSLTVLSALPVVSFSEQ